MAFQILQLTMFVDLFRHKKTDELAHQFFYLLN